MTNEMSFTNITHDGQTWRIHDSGEGTPVVLFHGFPDSPHAFAEVAAALRERGYRTILPYLRGYHPDTVVAGRPYDNIHLGHDGVRLLDALGLENAIVVGHDWGASLAYGMAAYAPDRVKALVTIAIPHPASLKPNPKAGWALRHFLYFKAPLAEWRTKRNNFAYMGKMVRRLDPTISPPAFEAYMQNIRSLFGQPEVLTGMLDYYRGFEFNLDSEFLKKWEMPSLLVAGSLEVPALGGLGAYEASARRFIPKGDFYIMEGAGHSPHMHNVDEFMTQIDKFFAEKDL